MSTLKHIIKNGNTNGHSGVKRTKVECMDGFSMTVKAGPLTASHPRVSPCDVGRDSDDPMKMMAPHPQDRIGYEPCVYEGPYSHLEVSEVADIPHPWSQWCNYASDENHPKDATYWHVPVAMVKELVSHHGGELG